jgi:hypothetical protein
MARIPETDKEAWKRMEELAGLYMEKWEEEPRTMNSNIPVEEFSYEFLELVEEAVKSGKELHVVAEAPEYDGNIRW